jgi:tRNA(Ile)-lysidine synthase
VTDPVEQKVIEFIRLHGVFADAERILLAVSGGADSMALLHILKALQVTGHLHADLACAHINHQLRGTESDADERVVVEEAARLELPVNVRSVDVRAFARMHGLSIETAARQLRLENLRGIARDSGCTWIASGHQKNDNAETVVHRLRRGTGLRGLAGIRPIRRLDENLRLARPLLCVTREEIARYLGEHDLRWREDHTNADTAYTRNFIRHRLLPLLQQESQTSLAEGLSELAICAGKLYDRVQREAERAQVSMLRVSNDEVCIDAPGLASSPELVAVELIRRALVSLGCGERDLTEHHYRRVLALARRRAAAGETSLPRGFTARYESGRLVLHRRRRVGNGVQRVSQVLSVPGRTQFGGHEIDTKLLRRDEIDTTRIGGDKSPWSEYLDWDCVRPPVVVRWRRAGDRFQPLGLSAVTKVGKFLTAARVSRERRGQTMVFADQEKIVWLCPVRIAEPVKITERTQRILALTVQSTTT